MGNPVKQKRLSISIPNMITVVRILLTPIFVIFLEKGLFGYALAVFFVAAVSDGLDGFLARYFNQRTELGAYLDPIADKLLLTTAFIGLALWGHLPVWLGVLVVSRDVMITMGIAVLTMSNISFQVRPSSLSKMTTFIQLFTICLALLSPNTALPANMLTLSFWATAIITILSGGHYLVQGLLKLQKGMNHKDSQR